MIKIMLRTIICNVAALMCICSALAESDNTALPQGTALLDQEYYHNFLTGETDIKLEYVIKNNSGKTLTLKDYVLPCECSEGVFEPSTIISKGLADGEKGKLILTVKVKRGTKKKKLDLMYVVSDGENNYAHMTTFVIREQKKIRFSAKNLTWNVGPEGVGAQRTIEVYKYDTSREYTFDIDKDRFDLKVEKNRLVITPLKPHFYQGYLNIFRMDGKKRKLVDSIELKQMRLHELPPSGS